MLPVLLGLTATEAAIGLGGGLYEFSIVDAAWPKRIDIIQPGRGGISRRRFWIPAHIAFEVPLILSLVVAWTRPEIRFWLLVALASHVVMRIWSAVDFIPKALAFEKAEVSGKTEAAARRWAARSRWRFPLDIVTCAAAMLASWAAAAGAAG